MPEYRYLTRQCVERAQKHIEAKEDQALIYAALELRLALEYLTYDRAYAYREYIPPDEYDTWQPRKLMKVLLDIDPHADKSCEVAYAPEVSPGVVAPGTKFTNLGSETVVSLKDIKAHYDAFGSYLHAPTIHQIETPDIERMAKLRKRCNEALAIVGKALASKIHNVIFGAVAEVICSRCEKPIKRRLSFDTHDTEATCFHCGAPYRITVNPDHSTTWKPRNVTVPCQNGECGELHYIWLDHFEPGAWWTCGACKQENEVTWGVRKRENK